MAPSLFERLGVKAAPPRAAEPQTIPPVVINGHEFRPFQRASRYLGLDLSLTGTGTCWLVDGVHAAETIAPKTIRGVQRLVWVVDRLPLEDVRLAAVEGYGFGAEHSHQASLGELGGVVRLALWRAGLPFVVVPPAVLKRFIAGKGNADKVAMGVALSKGWGVEFPDHNQADAFSLALFAAAYDGHPTKPLTEAQKQAIATVQRNPHCTYQPPTKKPSRGA